MKKLTAIGITIIFSLFCFISCEKRPLAPKAGKAVAQDMLSLIPKDTTAVFFVDFHRAINTEPADKFIRDEENYEDYQEFMEKTGIDPRQDIYFIAAAITGGMEKPEQEGVAIINLKYNKNTLLSMIKEKKEKELELTEEEYNGYTIYTVKEENKEKSFSFIDDSNIAAGNENEVKYVIDVLQKKGENVLKNESFSVLFEKTNKEALLWGAVIVPPEVTSKISAENPLLQPFKDISAASLYFDYQNRNIIAEIKLMTGDPMKNQELADNLNGFKTMGAMITIQDLNLGELLNRIEITSEPDHVNIYAIIPEDLPQNLIDKLKVEKLKEEKEEY